MGHLRDADCFVDNRGPAQKRRHFVGMTFENLPTDWNKLPLSDPTLAIDVVDLFISEADRAAGVVSVLLCDEQDRLLAPVAVSLDGYPGGPADVGILMKPFILALNARPGGACLVALGRRGPLESPTDDEWALHVAQACEESGVRLLGFYVATPEGVLQLEAGAVA